MGPPAGKAAEGALCSQARLGDPGGGGSIGSGIGSIGGIGSSAAPAVSLPVASRSPSYPAASYPPASTYSTTTSSARGPAREGGAAQGTPPTDGGPGTNADMLRLALSRLDVDVALQEILTFLQSDERLPGRTRKAVQFLHGLRQQMVYAQAHVHHPEHFDCPLASACNSEYTFREVRKGYGDAFQEQFWPIFQAFNCVLPAHSPEEHSS